MKILFLTLSKINNIEEAKRIIENITIIYINKKRENKLSINSWREIYNRVKKNCAKIYKNLPEIIEKNYQYFHHTPRCSLLFGIPPRARCKSAHVNIAL